MTATLSELIRQTGALATRRLCGLEGDMPLADAIAASWFDCPVEALRGRSILIATEGQFATAGALIACDGVARRMVICPPGLSAGDLRSIADTAAIDTVLRDEGKGADPLPGIQTVRISRAPAIATDTPTVPPSDGAERNLETQWVLPTSGTSGPPKLVVHTLQTLTGAISAPASKTLPVWSSFYDIRRYGGLQIFLRAMTGGTMILSDSGEPAAAFLARAGAKGVTHISGTPSHWRRALMSPRDTSFTPSYVRLSGEIVDQAILDRLGAVFPDARIAHAFASTEAGVAFDVGDGQAGFPVALVGCGGQVSLRVENGSLQIRSARTAHSYLGRETPAIGEPDGFVDTGDMVEQRGDRYHFIGRRSGIINVGGLKIHPEEVEAVILDHPGVRMCVVSARRSPITGAMVTAEVVADQEEGVLPTAEALSDAIMSLCRRRLARHKVPVSIRLVSALDIAGSGKMRR